MAELPGWDRSRLLTAATADVEAARMIVYARALEPMITEPYDAHLEVVDIEGIKDAKRRDRAVERHRAKRRGLIVQAASDQKRYRLLLGLDEADEPDVEDDAGEVVL